MEIQVEEKLTCSVHLIEFWAQVKRFTNSQQVSVSQLVVRLLV